MYCKGWEYEINTKGFHLGHGYLKLGSWIYVTDLVKSQAPLWSKHLFCLRSCPSLHFFLILLSLDHFFCPQLTHLLFPTWMCHCFYQLRGLWLLKRSEVMLCRTVPKIQHSFLFTFSLVDKALLLVVPDGCWWHPPQPRLWGKWQDQSHPWSNPSGCINKGSKRRRGRRSWPNLMKMELPTANWMLAAACFLLSVCGGSAAPTECYFNSRGEILHFDISSFKTPSS